MIRFNCPHCQKSLSAPEEKAGVILSCPGCKQPVTISAPIAKLISENPVNLNIIGSPGSVGLPKLKPCPDCKRQVSERASKCPQCGGPLWHKTVNEAYFGSNGMGLLDLIPGIRDLPSAARFAIMTVVLIGIIFVIVPWLGSFGEVRYDNGRIFWHKGVQNASNTSTTTGQTTEKQATLFAGGKPLPKVETDLLYDLMGLTFSNWQWNGDTEITCELTRPQTKDRDAAQVQNFFGMLVKYKIYDNNSTLLDSGVHQDLLSLAVSGRRKVTIASPVLSKAHRIVLGLGGQDEKEKAAQKSQENHLVEKLSDQLKGKTKDEVKRLVGEPSIIGDFAENDPVIASLWTYKYRTPNFTVLFIKYKDGKTLADRVEWRWAGDLDTHNHKLAKPAENSKGWRMAWLLSEKTADEVKSILGEPTKKKGEGNDFGFDWIYEYKAPTKFDPDRKDNLTVSFSKHFSKHQDRKIFRVWSVMID
jgi:outer membrane protein assembly factor BamE (lipoprotein component of BamABCDE complex)